MSLILFYSYIVIAAVVGLVLGRIIFSRKREDSKANKVVESEVVLKTTEEYEKKISDVKSQLLVSEQKVSDLKNQYERKIDDVKSQLVSSEQKEKDLIQKYESLLNEAKSKVKELDENLKDALNGNIDGAIKKQLDEVEKLKKKIKDLEEENEEFEDDLDSIKKKLVIKEQEISNLQINLDKLSREKKQLQEELESTVDKLNDKSKELELKIESLSFIQEILTAKKSSDASVSNLYSKIDNISDFIRGELKETVGSIYNFNKETTDYLFGSGLESWSITAKKSWIQNKRTIAFVGEFSAGKTSIVNRILSQDNPDIPLLPVSTKATTAIPTYISGGEGTMYQFVTPNNELKNISEATFKRVTKDVLDQVQGVSALIQYFVMTYKNSNLEKLSILDTPGFNSNDKEDAERTIGVINECDALFWVFDVNAGTVNRGSIELIKKHLKKPLYVVINKIDTKPKSEVDKVEELIKKTLTDAGQSVQGFIRFSGKAPLEDIMSPIKSITHDDNKEKYIDNLLNAVSTWTDNQKKDVDESNQKMILIDRKSVSLKASFTKAFNSLCTDCDTMVGYLNYNEHEWNPFKDANYEVSVQGYNAMIGYRDKIQETHKDKLKKLYDKQIEATKSLQEAWNIYSREKEQWQQMNYCLEILRNKIKDLK